jgi:CBS domain-containing protein
VLAPLLIIGGALGAMEAPLIPFGDAGLWVGVSMAAMMGGTMRSPLTAIVFTLELTHDVNTLPALLAGCLMAYAFTVMALRRSILTEKLARRGHHVTREYSIDPLDLLRVSEVMDTDIPTVSGKTTVGELADAMAQPNSIMGTRHGIPITDEKNNLVGIVTRGDMIQALSEEDGRDQTVLDAGTNQLIVTYPDELLSDAVAEMVLNEIGRLPVVDPGEPNRLLGILGRSSVMKACTKVLELENNRETTWGTRSLKGTRSGA